MVSYTELATKNKSVDCSEQRALVSGGTQGIGAGIALRFALSGASVWLVGRNAEKASQVIEQLDKASAEAQRRRTINSSPSSSKPSDDAGSKHAFFQADLSTTSGIKDVADKISQKAGKGGIDYLIETQGGPPNPSIKKTSEGIESQFAVQCVSRFGLAKLLTEQGIVKRAVLMVASPAQGGSKKWDLDDIDFVKAKESGSYWGGPFGILKKGMRDSAILDSVAQTLAERNPNMTISHCFPGFIATDASANQGFPTPLVWASKLVAPLLAHKPGPGGYAELPFYLLANPDGQRYLETGQANLIGPKLKKYSITSSVQDGAERQRIWEKMSSYFA
ncbi:uncharacterized protein PFL1_03709 [Pseudozyma flocculosa PF-1]|uniref:NAD(P)-binding protein n=2 Tax=Pseudozyma flocculosa TaxID=84751 RepID=A0A5C3F3P9_9BASI|nr:uncharacterized protein PFL1_03709 [Pseudozyma flocculosa PF-1]EPQ28908.1 hypothetical protein PFL1_03709 [Pseudozyma flocculosa PF-1]SPO38605.1 uncharacterized protein PSFLO_04083 [Pseudozyma flocculosa]